MKGNFQVRTAKPRWDEVEFTNVLSIVLVVIILWVESVTRMGRFRCGGSLRGCRAKCEMRWCWTNEAHSLSSLVVFAHRFVSTLQFGWVHVSSYCMRWVWQNDFCWRVACAIVYWLRVRLKSEKSLTLFSLTLSALNDMKLNFYCENKHEAIAIINRVQWF